MADVVDKKKRSQMMSGIQGENTKPEVAIRKALHGRGFRYKLYDRSLPGRPDIVLPRYRAAIQIHGCFWHVHGCHLSKWPSSREEFWREKLGKNQARDIMTREEILALGWRLLIVWECSYKGARRLPFAQLIDRIEWWLRSGDPFMELAGEGISHD